MVLGVMTKQIDSNGLTTEWSYDTLGRLETEKHPDGSQTTTTLRTEISNVERRVERRNDHIWIFGAFVCRYRTYSIGR